MSKRRNGVKVATGIGRPCCGGGSDEKKWGGDKSMYFFAIQSGGRPAIDAVGDSLSESARFELIDLLEGLIAWDERGIAYKFVPTRKEGEGWHFEASGDDLNRFRSSLKEFVVMLSKNRKWKSRAHRLGLDISKIEDSSLEELIELVKRLQVKDNY